MKNLIINNPYRILGVYVGDSPAVEQKNHARFHAFEKVGQVYEISLVGEEDLPPIKRTEKIALESAQVLSLPADRIRHSLLWYSDGSTAWGKTLNEAVRSIVKGDYAKAIMEYDCLISTPALREEYISAVTNGLGNITVGELAEMLGIYFGEDKDFHIFLSNSDSIPSCFLSQWLYRGYLEESLKKSLKVLNETLSQITPGINFYQTLDKVKVVYNHVEKETSKCRCIYGVDSVEFQEYAVQVANFAYQISSELILKIGDYVWNQKCKVVDKGYLEYQTKMPMPVVKECMRLIKETDNLLNSFLNDLRLSSTSFMILYSQRESYQKILSQEYVTDNAILKKAVKEFYIKRGVTLALWLSFVIFIIIATFR